MDTYFNTQEGARKAANKAEKDNNRTSITMGSAQCDCGESFCYTLKCDWTGNRLQRFVVCEACKMNN